MPFRSVRFVPTFFLALAACSSDPVPEPSAWLLDTNGWAGGSVRVRMVDLPVPIGAVDLRLGETRLTPTFQDDSTLLVPLQEEMMGSMLPVTAIVAGTTIPLGNVIVRGFIESPQYLVEFGDGDIYLWPQGGEARIIGAARIGGSVRSIYAAMDLATGTVTSFDIPYDWSSLRGPGVTYRDSVFLFRSARAQTEPAVVRLPGGNPESVGALAQFLPGEGRQVAQLSPTVWLRVYNHHVVTSHGTIFGPNTVEDTYGVHMSPTHTRTTIRAVKLTMGLPVLSPTGELAFVLPQLSSSRAIDFSRDGTELLAGGLETGAPANSNRYRLMVVKAANGQVVENLEVEGRIQAAAFDPLRPLIYLALIRPGESRVVVRVFDRTVRRFVGTMVPPANATICADDEGCYRAVFASTASGSLYLYAGNQFGMYRGSARFTLPPVP